jgi:DDE superfamily endonuclease
VRGDGSSSRAGARVRACRVSAHRRGSLLPRGCSGIRGEPGLFIDYLEKLMHDIPGPIFLIVDGYPSHRSKETLEFVQGTEGRLNLFFLPPYSPELNPDEWVWKSIKHDRVGKMASRSVVEMRNGISRAVARLQSTTDFVLGFFCDPDLAYIGSSVQ